MNPPSFGQRNPSRLSVLGPLAPGCVLAYLLFTGCSAFQRTSWDYVERANGQGRVAVLRRPQEVLPAFGEDYSAVVKANAQVTKVAGGSLSAQSDLTLRELFDRQDQGNAQLRNFLVVAYALYINGEFETNAELRDRARARWSADIRNLQERAFTSRELGLEREHTVDQLRATVIEIARNVTGLGLEGPQGQALRARLQNEVPKLQALERTASLPPSDTAILGSALLSYTQKDYSSVIEKVKSLRTIMPEQLYVLAGAYIRAGEADSSKTTNYYDLARQSATLLFSLTAEPLLQSRTENILGFLELLQNDNVAAARKHYEATLKLDPKFSTGWYNVGGMWSRSSKTNSPTGPEIVKAVQCLNTYRVNAFLSSEAALKEAEEDQEKAYDNLFRAYDQDKKKIQRAMENSEPLQKPPD